MDVNGKDDRNLAWISDDVFKYLCHILFILISKEWCFLKADLFSFSNVNVFGFMFETYLQVFSTSDIMSFNTLKVGGMQTTTVISGLEPDTTYTIRVEAVTTDNKLLEVGEIEVTTEKGLLMYRTKGRRRSFCIIDYTCMV